MVRRNALPLHRVFHSIRFKVNKGWSTAVLLFLCPSITTLFICFLPTAITYDKKSRQSSLVSDFMATFATPSGVLFVSVGQTWESSSFKNKHSGK